MRLSLRDKRFGSFIEVRLWIPLQQLKTYSKFFTSLDKLNALLVYLKIKHICRSWLEFQHCTNNQSCLNSESGYKIYSFF